MGKLAVFLIPIWIIVGFPTRVFKECVTVPARSTTAFSKTTNITKLGVILTVPLTKKIHRTQPMKINTEGNTLKEILYTKRTPTKYATAWKQTQPRRRRYGWSGRECDIYANILQLHTCI